MEIIFNWVFVSMNNNFFSLLHNPIPKTINVLSLLLMRKLEKGVKEVYVRIIIPFLFNYFSNFSLILIFSIFYFSRYIANTILFSHYPIKVQYLVFFFFLISREIYVYRNISFSTFSGITLSF